MTTVSDDAENGLTRLVRELLEQQSESRSLDFKGPMMFGPSKAEKAERLKCMMAFANTRDGGYLLIGVEQNGGRFVPRGVTRDQARSFDPTDIGNFAKNYCSVSLHLTSQVVDVDGVDLLLVRVAEFDDEPVVCTKDLDDASGKAIVRAGSIYVLTPDARCVAIEASEAMRALLDLAIQKRGEALIGQIRRLVGSAPANHDNDAVSSAYVGEIADATTLFDREQLSEPYWDLEIEAYSGSGPHFVPSVSTELKVLCS